MGAVNDLGNAIVIGRNLGFSGLEKFDDDHNNMCKSNTNYTTLCYIAIYETLLV